MNQLRRLYRYGYPHRGRFWGAAVAMLAYAAASGGLLYLFKPIIDDVLPTRTGLAWVMSAIIGLSVWKGLAAYFSVYLMTDVGERLVRDLRSRLFGHILAQSAGFFARTSTGALMSRITNDVGRIQHAVAQTLGDLLRESVTLLVYAGILLYLDTGLALVCMTGAPVVVYPLAWLGQRVRRTTRRGQEELEHLSHITAEAFAGHRIVKAFAGRALRAATVRSGLRAVVPDEHEGHRLGVDAPAAHGVARGRRHRRRAVVRQPGDRRRRPHLGRFRFVHRRHAVDVRGRSESSAA